MIDVFLTLLNSAIIAGAILIVAGIVRCVRRGGVLEMSNDEKNMTKWEIIQKAKKNIAEAERLTKKHNEPHTILKAVGIVRPAEVVTILEEMREWPADQ